VREVSDKMLGQMEENNVLRMLQITQIQHTYVISSQKIKLFSPTLLLNKSDFLGTFKKVLRGV
jgi:hypothetical protein